MGSFVLRRVLALIPLLLLITFIVYALVLVIPGDPARTLAGGTKATPQAVAAMRLRLHLNEPIYQQYWRWLTQALQGNLGKPLFGGSQTVAEGIKSRFPVTLSLALGAMFVALVIGVPAGVISGIRAGTWQDRSTTFGTSLGIAIPDFWLAMMLVVVFAVKTHVLPATGYVPITKDPWGWLQDMILPCLALGVAGGCSIARQLRGALIDVLDQDYIRTARSMGLKSRRVIGIYALKNAATPVLTVIGLQFAYLLGGTFIIEQIFSIPGLGSYILGAIDTKDLPVIQGVVLVTAVIFVFVNLLVDISYGYLSPKVRAQ